MTANRNAKFAWKYHNATKHSYESVRADTHRLDWRNEPLPFKIYSTLEPLPLPRESPPTGVPALRALAGPSPPARTEAVPDLKALASILYYSAGITKKAAYPGGEIYFRAASCTGALYEIELYLVCGDLPGLAAGIYHFGAHDFALRRLRTGDHRALLAQACGSHPAVTHAPVSIICTGTYWRNAWKYQARTYRHFGWDNGTLLANLLAMCAAQRFPAGVVCAFLDDEVNRLLDLDTQREVAFSMVPVGFAPSEPPPAPAELPALNLETEPLSKKEVDYPLMREMHAASSLYSVEEVKAWAGGVRLDALPAPTGRTFALEPFSEAELSTRPIEEVILRRGSTRRFARKSITFQQLSTILDRATRGLPADFLPSPDAQLNQLYLIVNAVEGLPAGAYVYHRERRVLECLQEGNFRAQASYLGLEQALPGDASVAIFFLADLHAILKRLGNRGYRAVQLEAGILGGKMYLAAYAQRLGATGLTFFDDDVTEFFSPHAKGKSAIFLMALGKSVKRLKRI